MRRLQVEGLGQIKSHFPQTVALFFHVDRGSHTQTQRKDSIRGSERRENVHLVIQNSNGMFNFNNILALMKKSQGNTLMI